MFDYFVDSEICTAKSAETFFTNPDYADLMQRLSLQRAKAFYGAQQLVDKDAIDRNPTGDATVSLGDLQDYQVIEREPICQDYSEYKICSMGPPSSGSLAVGQIFGILSSFDIAGSSVQDPEMVHLFTQAMRLACADRNLYVADDDYVAVPTEGMMQTDYLATRSGLVNLTLDMGELRLELSLERLIQRPLLKNGISRVQLLTSVLSINTATRCP